MNNIIGVRSQESGVRSQESGVIHLYIGGRCGNQLFQYASVRGLQAKFYPNYKIIINTYRFTRLSEQEKMDKGWENSLKYFRLKDVEYISARSRKTRTWIQNILIWSTVLFYRLLNKLKLLKTEQFIELKLVQPIFSIFGIYTPITVPVPTKKPLFSLSRNIFYRAFAWNRRDFDDLRDTLLEEFTPVCDVLPHNQQLMKDIQESESVCVTIRRGDFLYPEFAFKHNVCNEEYFITAMKAIREELPNCKFFVFSDDVEEVKRIMHFPFDVTYERGDDPVWEKLRLMYSCKHFIISNSTFSVWAQYLSRNPNKIVYAPIPWVWGGGNGESIYPDNVRTIQCHK